MKPLLQVNPSEEMDPKETERPFETAPEVTGPPQGERKGSFRN
jgi:hypothetical protein